MPATYFFEFCSGITLQKDSEMPALFGHGREWVDIVVTGGDAGSFIDQRRISCPIRNVTITGDVSLDRTIETRGNIVFEKANITVGMHCGLSVRCHRFELRGSLVDLPSYADEKAYLYVDIIANTMYVSSCTFDRALVIYHAPEEYSGSPLSTAIRINSDIASKSNPVVIRKMSGGVINIMHIPIWEHDAIVVHNIRDDAILICIGYERVVCVNTITEEDIQPLAERFGRCNNALVDKYTNHVWSFINSWAEVNRWYFHEQA